MGKHLADCAALDDEATLDDGEVEIETDDKREVVRDQQICEAAGFLQRREQSQNLGLHDEIETGKRFIEDQQFRGKSQGASDGEALSLAAAQSQYGLLRQFRSESGEAHAFQGNFALLASLSRTLNLQRLSDGLEGGESGIEHQR